MGEWHRAADADIRCLQAEYAFCADRARTEQCAGLFTPDGVLRIVGGAYDGLVHDGAPAIKDYLASVAGDLVEVGMTEIHRHHVAPAHIEFLGKDIARAESCFHAVRASGPDHWGVYRDRLVLVDGEWRFAERVIRIEGTNPGSWQHKVAQLHREGGQR
jgi:SnoaL-like domain